MLQQDRDMHTHTHTHTHIGPIESIKLHTHRHVFGRAAHRHRPRVGPLHPALGEAEVAQPHVALRVEEDVLGLCVCVFFVV